MSAEGAESYANECGDGAGGEKEAVHGIIVLVARFRDRFGNGQIFAYGGEAPRFSDTTMSPFWMTIWR